VKQPPVVLVVDADGPARTETESALSERFGRQYRIVTADSPGAAHEFLVRMVADQEDIALIAADLHLPGQDGVQLLERAHGLHPGAVRALLVSMDEHHTRMPLTELGTVQQALALGRIDLSIVKGWVTPEEWLYPQVQEALSGWNRQHRPGHVVYDVVGPQWAPRSHEFRDLLTRNGVPFRFTDSDSAAGQALVRKYRLDENRLPALIHHNGAVLHDPPVADLARHHGIQSSPRSESYDLVILGAGPAGLAAAVYGASEGLDTLVLEPEAIGGQAATSSMIRNYLGFPRGVGGGDLAHRAWEQAVLLGAEFVFGHVASRLSAADGRRLVALSDGTDVSARSVIVAAGVTYRRLGIPTLDRHVGAGVFYGAARSEAPAMAGQSVFVVGGANSAGQAALHLARYAEKVTLLIRANSLAAGMSDYLVRQLRATANVDVRLRARVIEGHGQSRLESLTVEDLDTGVRQEVPAAAVFVLIGAEPRTAWLRESVSLDRRGFVYTGRDIPAHHWPYSRSPLPFETSMPGVFAAGDVRHGSVKRVAGAVGEGSVTVGSVHEYLALEALD